MATTYTLVGWRSANEDSIRGAGAAGPSHSHRLVHVVPDPASAIGKGPDRVCDRGFRHFPSSGIGPLDSERSISPILAHLRKEVRVSHRGDAGAVLGGDRGHPCDRRVLDVRGGGAGVLVWRSVIEVEEEVRRDELSEKTAKPIPGPDGKALPVAREGIRLRAVIAAGRIALTEKVPKLLDDTLFAPRVPNIYFKCQHHVSGTPQDSEIRGVLLMIERGLPMCFEAITYAHSTILRHYINDVEEAFESLPPRNAYGSVNPAIEKGPGAIITPCTNYEQCPMLVSGPTDGPQRKYYCGFSHCNESPSYLESSVPKRPVRPALSTTGLTQAFSGTTGQDCGKAASPNQSRVWPGSPAGRCFK
ncbi:hypothetical protein HOY80DRAFT_1030013 [Tuber brumale]|nr:hypothetical protein HOY80DRAFT_1030013 [Tuber brumale]